jgi:hypothetical protein
VTPPSRSLIFAAAFGALAACEHAQPFGTADLGANVPFASGLPRQLTFSAGGDLTPAWLPDSSAVAYSYQRTDLATGGRCLGVLPADGGRRTQEICHTPLRAADSTNSLFEPAAGPAGLVAYVRESSAPGAPAPDARELVVARLGNADSVRVLQRMPFTLAGQLYYGASHVRWLDDHTLVYLAEFIAYREPPAAPDTVRSGLDIVRLSFGGDSVSSTVLPGTRYASSVAADSAGAIYYTLGGDTRVYRVAPGGGTASLVHDFAAAGIARDVQVRGTRLVAVVGGAVRFGVDPAYGPIQVDAGGKVYVVDLVAGTGAPISLRDTVFRHPALSPSGSRLVAEAYRGGSANLWLYAVP